MRKFVTIIIIIVSIGAGAMFIKAMLELEKEASNYLDSKQDSAVIKSTENELSNTQNTDTDTDSESKKSDTSGGDELDIRNKIYHLIDSSGLSDDIKAQPKLIIGELYEDLFNDLGLTDEEIDQFSDLTIISSAEKFKYDETNNNDSKIKELIGELYYEDYTGYNQTLSERIRVIEYKQRLELSEIPLLPQQQQNLIELMLQDCDTKCDENIIDNSIDFLDLEQVAVLEEYLSESSDSNH